MFLANPLTDAKRQFAASDARRTAMNSARPRADAPLTPPARPAPSSPVPPPALHKARADERGRIKAILLSEPAKHNPVGALHLALNSSTPTDQAIDVLAFMPVPAPVNASATLAEQILAAGQMARSGGHSIKPPAPSSVAGQIILAGRKARGETRKAAR